jgi:probable F420-dependent oxidoreductase
MKIDAALIPTNLQDVPAIARAAEAIGFDALWTGETRHDPFLPLVLAAEHTRRIGLGTAIAVAFARSPMNVANLAWDLAALSGGRFRLGLGTQVKPHIERRFGMTWESPAAKLREYVLALRAIWDCWQNGTPLNFRGEFYKLTLMTPFFNPGPISHPHILVSIAGVNPQLLQVAGEVCDGFQIHPLHTAQYVRQVIIPNLAAGAARAGRRRADLELTTSQFVIAGHTDAEIEAAKAPVREQVAFYASTPTYRVILDVHGWGEVGERLSHHAARKQWDQMPALITDDMLEEFAIVGRWDEIPARIKARYDGLLDRVTYYLPFVPGQDEARWRQTVEAFVR